MSDSADFPLFDAAFFFAGAFAARAGFFVRRPSPGGPARAVAAVVAERQSLARLNAIDGAHQVRHHRLQVGEQRRVGARAGEILRVERDRHDRLVPQRRLRANIAVRSGDDRSAGEGLSAFGADEIHQRHEHAVLLGDVAREALPPLEIGGYRTFVLARPHSARGRRRQNEYEVGTIERGDGSGEAVPGVLADQHRGAAPARVECANLESAIDEPFFVEHSVGRKEQLAVTCRITGPPLAAQASHRARYYRRRCSTPRRTQCTHRAAAV